MTEPLNITDAQFENEVLQSSTPVVVDFWAPWCAPCRMVAPTIESLSKELEEHYQDIQAKLPGSAVPPKALTIIAVQ